MGKTHAVGHIEVDTYKPGTYESGTDGGPDLVEPCPG
jgi:hypothetical protein